MRFVQSTGVLMVAGLTAVMGCQIIAGVDGDAVYVPNEGGASGTGSPMGGAGGMGGAMVSVASSSSGTGGTGGAPECLEKDDCPKYECKVATACVGGLCVWQNDPMGSNVLPQLQGDCKLALCDGNGGITFVDDPGDTYYWMNPCLLKTCDPSLPGQLDPNVTMCTTAWGVMGTCDPTLKTCVECTTNNDCASNFCHVPSGRCYPSLCDDGTKSGAETDIDCGGVMCPDCADGLACSQNSDCTGACDMGMKKCIPPTCSDAIRNGDETDIDCGGSCVEKASQKCSSLLKCLYPSDCQSGVCKLGICEEPNCFDGVQNQGETGIDCGGPCPVSCP